MAAAEEEENQHSETLLWAIHMCFNSKLYADVSIRLGGVEIPAHAIVLSAQSEYFKAALRSPMKEATEKKFEYKEGSMHAHWRVFEYLYRGEYSEDPAPPLLPIADDDELIKDIRVYQLADYFRVEGLREYALHNFESKIKHLWVSESFVDCIREVYGATDLGYEMRKAILQVVRGHLGELWEKKAFRLLVREGGDFPMEIISGFINK
ncbi:uncharacterized protein TRIREDRAFT_102952 [Trichoderma reesei QM6a]|uniref:Predicted protein n=1 Tax=Hypocrea jecorina (strain QM6a) TaxID=431241 RepID=G0R8R3_HYPJQ|nr:uncharacterized protein TRIREDRAFT_102952 [Trichoderma reesei QM6a]EGR52930.1 predicted protein [Trichoderma reesei QM6a]